MLSRIHRPFALLLFCSVILLPAVLQATQIMTLMIFPRGTPLDRFVGVSISSPESRTIVGNEHKHESVKLFAAMSLLKVQRPAENPGSLEVYMLTKPTAAMAPHYDYKHRKITFQADQHEQRTPYFHLQLLDASGQPQEAQGEVAYVDATIRGTYGDIRKVRFVAGDTTGKEIGDIIHIRDAKEEIYTLEELKIEVLRNSEGNIQQIKTPFHLLNVIQKDEDTLWTAIYELDDKNLERKDGFYAVPRDWVAKVEKRIQRVDAEAGARALKCLTFVYGRQHAESNWYYHAENDKYAFSILENNFTGPRISISQTGSKAQGTMTEKIIRHPVRNKPVLYENEYRWFENSEERKPVSLKTSYTGGRVDWEYYGYYEEGPYLGRLKTRFWNQEDATPGEGLWEFYAYSEEGAFQVSKVIKAQRQKVKVETDDSAELSAVLDAFSTEEQFEEKWVWPALPEPPDTIEQALKLGKVREERIITLANEFSLDPCESKEVTYYLQGGAFQKREWVTTGLNSRGGSFQLIESSKYPDVDYGDGGNRWEIKEGFGPEEIPPWVYKDPVTKSETTSRGYTIRRYVETGIWDKNTGTFQVQETGPHMRIEETRGKSFGMQWEPKTRVITKIYPRPFYAEYAPIYRDTWILQKDRSWKQEAQ
ncbi:hypothetical protein P0Y35_04260 [Kiritimatiellaeota bacterium B1221]|nr:hypothetical protein [Kiritimatiellaeota bacterium B1221]